jgi:hypothetical protein
MGYTDSDVSASWSKTELYLFRFFFIFFVLLVVPLDWKFYRELFTIQWSDLHFYDLLNLTRYSPQFVADDSLPKYGIGSFANWGIAAFLSLVGTGAWSYFDGDKRQYSNLYYWLRVALRYRLAIGIIAFGFIKLFPLQLPFPSLSNLHTNYGDFFAWKIYYHTHGIAPKYVSFLGAVEIFAGLLILNRKTATFGAGLIVGFTGNVLAANFAYQIGEQVYGSLLVLMATFLLAYDGPRLYRLLFLEKRTTANKFIPDFSEKWLQNARLALKVAAFSFIVLFGYQSYASYTGQNYLVPKTPGLAGAYGFYNVREFKLNGTIIPYSLTDKDRWQNVIFEKWSTLSIKIARPIRLDMTNGEGVHEHDIDRNFELAGVGGRHYFFYQSDTLRHTLSLQNKNINHRHEKLSLTYHFPNDSTLLLTGLNENRDSIHVTLDKVNKKYMMLEGRRKPVKL